MLGDTRKLVLAALCVITAAACALTARNTECARYEEQQVYQETCTVMGPRGCEVRRGGYVTQRYCARYHCLVGYNAPDDDPLHGCYAGEDYDRRRAAYLATLPSKPVPVYDRGQANGDSSKPTFSPDGTHVVFVSEATNLVDGDATGVYMKDLRTGAITSLSVLPDNSGPIPAALGFCSQVTELSSTADGKRQVANCHDGTDWVPYLVEGTKLTPLCPKANNGCMHPAISANGSRIAFLSSSTNLVPGDTTQQTHIFLLEQGRLTRISTAADGTPANGLCLDPAISPDGNLVAFSSRATNLVDHDTNLATDIFVKDLVSGKVVRVSERPQ